MPAHAYDEGNAEARAISCVQLFETLELRFAQSVEPQAALLLARLRCHGAGARYPAAELRMAAHERELLGIPGGRDRGHQRAMQVGDGGERPRGVRLLRHPG